MSAWSLQNNPVVKNLAAETTLPTILSNTTRATSVQSFVSTSNVQKRPSTLPPPLLQRPFVVPPGPPTNIKRKVWGLGSFGLKVVTLLATRLQEVTIRLLLGLFGLLEEPFLLCARLEPALGRQDVLRLRMDVAKMPSVETDTLVDILAFATGALG